MGLSNSENMRLSENDLINAVEFNFVAKNNKSPTTTTALDLSHDEYCRHILSSRSTTTSQQEDKFDKLVSTLKLKIPTAQENNNINDDGFMTPTSLDHKIQTVLIKCPPAPRKPKSVWSASSTTEMKRRSSAARRRVLLDVSAEIESLFPLANRVGSKINKFHKGTRT